MSVAKNVSKVGFATFSSRIFGLIREQVFAALIGAGYHADCFFIAFRIPNLLRDLFAEGALTQAFVPIFTRIRQEQGDARAFELANKVLTLITLIIGSLVILGMIFAPQIVAVMAPGFSQIEGKSDLTILLTRIMFPFLWMVSVAALLMGVLNVFREFSVPAFAPVMFNLVSIFGGVILWALDLQTQGAVIGWSLATLVGGMAQALIQMPRALRVGYRPRLNLKELFGDSRVNQVLGLMAPAVISNAGTQVNVLINTVLASLLAQGTASWLNYAFRLMQFPIGVFGVSISTVTLAKTSDEAGRSDLGAVSESLSVALRWVLLLTIPCSIGFWILGRPLIALIYERGAFLHSDTVATAQALAAYAVGLPAYAAVKVLAPSFFALKDPRSPMISSLLGIGTNIGFNVLTYQSLGHFGLALGTSLGMFVNVGSLCLLLRRKHLRLNLKRLTTLIGPLVLALAMMSATCVAGLKISSSPWAVLPITGAATLVYFLTLGALGISETRQLRDTLIKRLGSKR